MCWWSLAKSLVGSTSNSRSATPSAYQLANFLSNLFKPADSHTCRLSYCHTSLFSQFRINISHVRHVLSSLEITKTVGDDSVSPCLLKSFAPALSGPLTTGSNTTDVGVSPAITTFINHIRRAEFQGAFDHVQ